MVLTGHGVRGGIIIIRNPKGESLTNCAKSRFFSVQEFTSYGTTNRETSNMQCVCVCACVERCAYMHRYVYTYVFVSVCICVYMYTYAHKLCTHSRKCTRRHLHLCMGQQVTCVSFVEGHPSCLHAECARIGTSSRSHRDLHM